jgi:spermidine/putrescine transport system substrate-binding protein
MPASPSAGKVRIVRQRRTQRTGLTRLVAVITALALAGVACETDGDPPADDADGAAADSLTILEWAGYELEEFYPQFAEERGDVDLDFQFGDSDADFLTKVQSGGVSANIVHPCAGWVELWVAEGLAQPLDPSLLSNWDDLDEEFRELGNVDGEYYFAPFDWGYTSVVVASDRVDEVPTSWQALWDEEYNDRTAIWDDAEEAVVMTAFAHGLNPYDMSEEDEELVRDRLRALVENSKTFWEAVFEANQLMIDGEVDIAMAWNETFAAMEFEGVDAEFIDPEEGRLGWVCGYIVLDEPGTPEYELAHEFIDSAFSPEAGQYLIEEYYYGHANAIAIENADQEVVEYMEFDDSDIRARTNLYQPITQEQREEWSRWWSEATS